MLVIDDDNYYLAIGRDAASTIESLGVDEKVTEWIKDLELPDIDGECRSLFSYRRTSATNEEMLDYVYGHKPITRSRRLFSAPIISTGTIAEKYNHKRSNPFVVQHRSIPEETTTLTLEAMSGQEQAQRDVKPSVNENITSEHVSMSTSQPPLPSENKQGQYIDYHTSDIDSSSGGNYVDHSIAISTDSVYQSFNTGVCVGKHHLESLSIPFPDEQGTSFTNDQCTTPTTGVYQSHNIAVDYNHADNVNSLELV